MRNRTENTRSPRLGRGGCIGLVLLLVLAGPLPAGDVLKQIPADIPGFIYFPNLAASNERLTELFKHFDEDYEAADLDAFGEEVNLSPGTWDPSSPVVLILTRPELNADSLLVAYRPRGQQLVKKAALRQGRPSRCECPIGTCWVVMRGPVAFAAQKRSALRVLREVPEDGSVAATLDSVERQMLDTSDVFGRMTMSRWREKNSFYINMGINMMRWGMTAEADPEQLPLMQALMNWFADGIQTVSDQMSTISISAGYDEKTLRLTHHHRFEKDKSVAKYLGCVTRDKSDMLATLPDRSFWMAATSNWRCPPGQAITARLTRYVMNVDQMKEKVRPELRRKIVREVEACYGQMRGSAVMLSAPTACLFPMQIVGSYMLDDAARGQKEICFIQENANATMSVFMPGADLQGRFEEKEEEGFRFHEMSMNMDKISPKMRTEIALAYGENVRFQNMVLGKHETAFCIAEPPASIVQLARMRKGGEPTLANNAEIKKLLARMPADPNILVIMDLERFFASLPTLVAQSAHPGQPVPKSLRRPPSKEAEAEAAARPSRTLIGWACTVGDGRFTGELVIDADDAVAAVCSARKMVEDARRLEKAEKE
ncbi:MAG: hypothetical protein DCC63_14645 [Nitrospira sp.]|nr:MAG: hypothetical protein DCC63_14645 [Nitrospira sp.]